MANNYQYELTDASNWNGAATRVLRHERATTTFGPARQLVLSWTCAGLTMFFLVLTALYASQTTVASQIHFLYGSSSATIFVLSVLSGLTNLFLTALIAATYERMQWLLTARRGGVRYSEFLSLHAGTGVPGLLSLVFGRGHPVFSSTRLWSAIRLLSLALVPVLGILIMSESSGDDLVELSFRGTRSLP